MAKWLRWDAEGVVLRQSARLFCPPRGVGGCCISKIDVLTIFLTA
jgi:hypothetical protein